MPQRCVSTLTSAVIPRLESASAALGSPSSRINRAVIRWVWESPVESGWGTDLGDFRVLNKRPLSCLAVVVCTAVATGLAPSAGAQPQGNLIRNHSFEQRVRGSGWEGLWEIRQELNSRGQQSRTRRFMTDGRFGFKLLPNAGNVLDTLRLRYGVFQLLPVDELRGRTLLYEGWMNGVGGAEALIEVVAVLADGNSIIRTVRARSDAPADSIAEPIHRRDFFDVPDQPLAWLFLTLSVEGESGVAYFDNISVSVAPPAAELQGRPDPGHALSASSNVDYHAVVRDIPDTLYGINVLYPAGGYGVWSSDHDLPNPAMMDLARELGPTQIRFPGGSFANFYHWRNGVGPVNRRPLTLLAPDRGTAGNQFGTDEALRVADELGAPLFITVNADTGTAEEAADWVRYVNDGGRRVEYWEVGNELYFHPDPSDPTSGRSWLPSNYVKQYLKFAEAMRAADPGIKLAADVEFNLSMRGCGVIDGEGCWADVLLRELGHEIDVLALHSALAPIMVGFDPGWDARTVYSTLLAAPIEVRELLEVLSRRVDELTSPADAARIRFAMTEWGALFASDPRNRFIDHSKTLGSALFVASMLKTMIEHPRMEIAHGFDLVDNWTSGWIGTRDGELVPRAPFRAFQLYREHFGAQLLDSETHSPTYDARSVALVGAVDDVPYLDVISSKNPDQPGLRVVAVNKHFDRPIVGRFRVAGFAARSADAWTLTGTAIDAHAGAKPLFGAAESVFEPQAVADPDGRFNHGGPGEISYVQTQAALAGSCFEYEFPARSATALVISGVELAPGSVEGCNDPGPSDEILALCEESPEHPACQGL